MPPIRWAILTGEYPPQTGGVADYTAQVARGLGAAGDAVTVYAPRHHQGTDTVIPGVTVRRLPDHFGPQGLLALDTALARCPRPDRVLIQYVPHAFGWKAMNVPFAAWVAARLRRIAPVWVMFHEIDYPFRWRPLSHAALGLAHRIMARLVVGAASRVMVSIPQWAVRLRRFCPRSQPAEWLPVPSNILDTGTSNAIVASGTVIGHFGTYGGSTTALLEPALTLLLGRNPDRSALLLGRGGPAFRDQLVGRHPELAGRLSAPGELPPDRLAAHLKACHLVVQPYIDGISSRRTSTMTGLALARPVVSNLGPLSEPFWADTGCVALASVPGPNELAAAAEAVLALSFEDRRELGQRAAALYRAQFSLEHTLARLRTFDDRPRPRVG